MPQSPDAMLNYLEDLGVDVPPGGGNVAITCPFHEDSHPSASVNRSLGLFNCSTGCGFSGDIIKLLITKEGLNYPDAKRRAEELADRGGSGLSRQHRGPRVST